MAQPLPSTLIQAGAQPVRPSRYKPIFTNRFFAGIWTQRNPLRDPSDVVHERFYGGKPDAMIDGANVEISNSLTPIRSPGLTVYGTGPATADAFYSFRQETVNGEDIFVIEDTATEIYNLSGSAAILTKTSGAGQAYFQGVGAYLYFGDGIDLGKWDGSKVWSFGNAAPTAAPTLTVVESGSAAVAWQASTVFSTMGLLVDANGNVQQLNSVNALGTNTTQFGETGTGQPAWNQTTGGTTTDNTVTWTNFGPVGLWAGSTLFQNRAAIYDPVTKCIFVQIASGGAQTSGASRPNFNAIYESITDDGGCRWGNYGVVGGSKMNLWAPSTAYTTFDSGSLMLVLEPVLYPAANGQTVYLQGCTTAGTSGTGGTAPPWATTAGYITTDNQLQWVCLGSKTWAANKAVTAWGGQGQLVFTVIEDSNGNMQVCITSGTTGSSAPTWHTNYGDQTNDGSAVWVCVGPPLSWAANTIWYLPSAGFAPPTSSQPYGGASIVDTNNNVQFVISSGKSGSGSHPTWNTTTGGTTTDSGITWYNEGAFSTASLAWSHGYEYAYSFGSRASTSPWVTTAPPEQTNPLGPPTGSGSGGISTASPTASITGSNTGAVVYVSGVGSLNAQDDTIYIWRTADGGQTLYFLTAIQNPAPLGPSTPGKWTLADTLPDVDLNILIEAPVADANDPPPAGFKPMCFYFGRLVGAVNNLLYMSGGPDTLVGNGTESFPPANVWTAPADIVMCIPISSGLLVFTKSDVYTLSGGPQISTFFLQPLLAGVGLLSPNAICVQGSTIYLFSADRQFLSLDPTSGVNELGFPIGDQFASWNPADVYVTFHVAGSEDKALYVSDGSTGWFRCNPNQAPDNNVVWSPKRNVTGGCQAVQSIETSPGVKTLLVGATSGGTILQRNLTTFTDDGADYTPYCTIGNIVLAQPGEIAIVESIVLEARKVGSAPTPAVMLGEIGSPGTFETLTESVTDPPQLEAPQSLYSLRFYLMQGAAPIKCRDLQVKISWPAEPFENELLTMTIYGAIEVEKAA
jgi:hypothetical protein